MGAARRAMGDDEQAHKNFEESLRYNASQFNAWLGLGLLAEKQGKIDEAVSDLSRSAEIQPTAQAYFELGRILAQTGHAPEAIDAYQRALKISPDLPEAQKAIDSLRQQKR
jgi:tetratricopeptide (TPR) repeat protein